MAGTREGDTGSSLKDVRSAMSAGEAASYIADLASELARLARGSGLDFLGHLLEVAQLEAAEASRRPRATP